VGHPVVPRKRHQAAEPAGLSIVRFHIRTKRSTTHTASGLRKSFTHTHIHYAMSHSDFDVTS